MDTEEVFVNSYTFNPISQVIKGNFKVSCQTIQSRSRNPDLRLRGAGVEAEKNTFGSRLHTTLV